MRLEGYDAAPFVARRARLREVLGDSPCLFFAGTAAPRNYPANVYPFRASSHFLYFLGLPLEGAALLVDGEASTLFVDPAGEDDALWHGARPGPAEIARAAQTRTLPTSRLGDAIAGRRVATLPAPDLATQKRQVALFGRDASEPTEEDERLADAVVTLRLRHDTAAVDGLRRAAAATVEAHRAGMAATRPGVGESAIRAAMEGTLLARGMGTAYGSIVTVHGEVLHNTDSSNPTREGDLLLADVGAETPDGWAGDVTRTWPVSGRFSATQRELYEVVLAAQAAAIAAVRPGVRYRDVHVLASETLARGLVDLGILRGDPAELVADGVHALLFPHGIGHLLGLDVHDMEDLGDRAGYAPGRTRSSQFGLAYLRLDRDLAPGMAVTIEPGLYRVPAILEDPRLAALAGDRLDRAVLARFADVRGIRTEDDVLVTDDGAEVLTAGVPKAVAEIEAAVGG